MTIYARGLTKDHKRITKYLRTLRLDKTKVPKDLADYYALRTETIDRARTKGGYNKHIWRTSMRANSP